MKNWQLNFEQLEAFEPRVFLRGDRTNRPQREAGGHTSNWTVKAEEELEVLKRPRRCVALNHTGTWPFSETKMSSLLSSSGPVRSRVNVNPTRY